MLDRRGALFLAVWPLLAYSQPGQDLAARMRSGRCVVLMRHAQTNPGVGDPPDFDLAQCATQRNLNEAGRSQARAAGAWFRERGLHPSVVLTSAWCRCIDTAQLAFGRHETWPPLNSSFGRGDAPSQARPLLLERLSRVGAGRFEVWVTHQVNIGAFIGESTAMGEGVLVDTAGKVMGRSNFA